MNLNFGSGILVLAAILLSDLVENLDSNQIWEKCPYGLKYSVECVDCRCNPKSGTTECSDEECGHFETTGRCPNGTKFTIGCGNVCHCNKSNGDTMCMIVRCRKKYLKYLNRFSNQSQLSHKLFI